MRLRHEFQNLMIKYKIWNNIDIQLLQEKLWDLECELYKNKEEPKETGKTLCDIFR
jgi:hypothetical protein